MAENTFENGFTKFRVGILKAAQPFLDGLQSDKDNEYLEVFWNVLFDRSGSRHLNRNLSPQEQAFSKIWRGYVEIEESFEALGDIAMYIKHFPPKKVAVSKTRFLRLHVGNYLNEVYILKERLATYYKVVSRIYRNDPRLPAIKQMNSLGKKLLSSFDNVIAIRGAHVHQTRYEDNDLNRLSMLELLLQDESPSMAHVLYPTAIRETRKKWVETITRNNKEIARVLDIYFGALHLIIFDEQGKLISPIPTKRSG
jgi:hypothetical protein